MNGFMLYKMRTFLSFLLFFVGFMLFSSANWIASKFGPVTYEQILFHLNMPFDSETRMIASYCKNTVFTAVYILIGLYFLVFFKRQKKIPFIGSIRNFLYNKRLIITLVWFVFCLIFVFFKMNISDWIDIHKYKTETGTFYEENYIKGQDIVISAPAKKRNLVLIFVESMESTFAKTKNQNYFEDDLIPEIAALAKQGVNFSDTDDLGGAFAVDGTQWTQGGLVAQTCGIPIQLPIKDTNLFHPKYDFYPKAYCLYDILRDNGYETVFLIGSNGEFAGMDKFVKTHGNMKLLDTKYYSEKEGFWRGFENTLKLADSKVYAYAKDELTTLAKQGKPFAFTMMTLDTHYGTAVFDDTVCKRKFSTGKDDYYNFKDVIACASHQLGDFVAWLQKQDFYADTTVVIVGDHLAMNSVIFKDFMNRRPVNIFLNSAVLPKDNASFNRKFTPFDIYPSIVEALGFTLPDNRLALGVSLFSGKPTLLEQGQTVQSINQGIQKHSLVYDWLLFGKQVRNIK